MSDLPPIEQLKQRKIVQRGIAYLAGAFVVFQGVEVMAEPWGIAPAMQRTVHILLLAGFFFQLIIAWYHGEKGRQRISGTELLMLASVLLMAGVALSMLGTEEVASDPTDAGAPTAIGDGRPGVAVLPCENFSSDPADAHLAAGLHDQILLQLQKISSLFSIGRKSVEWYRDNPAPPVVIAKELGVGYMGECSVQKEGDRVQLTFQLLDGNTAKQLWAANYHEALTTDNLFEIQSDIAQQVAHQIGVVITPDERARIEAVPTSSLSAFQLYLLGRDRWTERSPETIREAIGYFERAIEQDPTFALAHTGMADSYLVLSFYDLGTDPLEIYDLARNAADRALELDPTLGEVQASLGFIAFAFEWDWAEAEERLSLAVELAPGYAFGHLWYSNLLGSLGRHEQAVEEMEIAFSLNPRGNNQAWTLAERLSAAGRSQEARPFFELALRADTPIPWVFANYANNLLTVDPVDPDKALDMYGSFLSLSGYPFPDRASTLMKAGNGGPGEVDDAVAVLEDVVDRTPLNRSDLLFAYAIFGRPDPFFSALDEAVRLRHFWVPFVPEVVYGTYLPQTASIEHDPRWEEFLERIRYPGPSG